MHTFIWVFLAILGGETILVLLLNLLPRLGWLGKDMAVILTKAPGLDAIVSPRENLSNFVIVYCNPILVGSLGNWRNHLRMVGAGSSDRRTIFGDAVMDFRPRISPPSDCQRWLANP